jgi:hypothetical protein
VLGDVNFQGWSSINSTAMLGYKLLSRREPYVLLHVYSRRTEDFHRDTVLFHTSSYEYSQWHHHKHRYNRHWYHDSHRHEQHSRLGQTR